MRSMDQANGLKKSEGTSDPEELPSNSLSDSKSSDTIPTITMKSAGDTAIDSAESASERTRPTEALPKSTCISAETAPVTDSPELDLSSSKTPSSGGDSEQPQPCQISGRPQAAGISQLSSADPEGQPPSEPTPEACGDPASNEASGDPPMSKRQRKRLAKRAEFLARLPEMRRAERQKRREKRAALAAAGTLLKKPRLTRMAEGGCEVGVCIDLSFEDLMEERDLRKCLKQVQRCYAANRRASQPLQLRLSSLEGVVERAPDVCADWHRWDVHAHQQHFTEVLQRDSVTYLSSDAPEVLERLEPGRTYVIGGLVDHNHHKGVCYQRAKEAGLASARLPIDEFIQLRTRQVLTIDHVFSILLRVVAGDGWQEAFCAVLPPRKGALPLSEAADGTETMEGDCAGEEPDEREMSCALGGEEEERGQTTEVEGTDGGGDQPAGDAVGQSEGDNPPQLTVGDGTAVCGRPEEDPAAPQKPGDAVADGDGAGPTPAEADKSVNCADGSESEPAQSVR